MRFTVKILESVKAHLKMKKRLSQQSLDTGFEMGYRYGLQEGIDILNDMINKVEENNEHL